MKNTNILAGVVALSLAGLASPLAQAESGSEPYRSGPAIVIKDSAITSSIKAQLAADHVTGFRHVRVDTDDHGVVTLKGHTRTQGAADRAVSIARDTQGVREVRSALKIKQDD